MLGVGGVIIALLIIELFHVASEGMQYTIYLCTVFVQLKILVPLLLLVRSQVPGQESDCSLILEHTA